MAIIVNGIKITTIRVNSTQMTQVYVDNVHVFGTESQGLSVYGLTKHSNYFWSFTSNLSFSELRNSSISLTVSFSYNAETQSVNLSATGSNHPMQSFSLGGVTWYVRIDFDDSTERVNIQLYGNSSGTVDASTISINAPTIFSGMSGGISNFVRQVVID